MPGAGGLIATNHLYVQAPQDGTVVAMVNATAPLAPLWGSRGARFETLKFNCDRRARSRRRHLRVLAHRAGQDLERSPEERGHRRLDRRRLADGGLCGDAQPAVRRQDQGGRRLQGRQRHRPRHAAQEIDGRCGTHLKSIPALHPDWISGQQAHWCRSSSSEKRNPDYPDTPAVMEFVKDKTTRQTLDLLTVTQKLDRPILAPPNTPAERLQELRTALAATARDPAFLAEIKKKNLTIEATGAEEMARIYADAYASPPDGGRGGEGDPGREIAASEGRANRLHRLADLARYIPGRVGV